LSGPDVLLGGGGNTQNGSKDSFLNYFFGAGGSGNGGGVSGVGVGGGIRGSGLSNSISGFPTEKENPLSGRKGFEGNAAAFEMKSLEKHLEAVSLVIYIIERDDIDRSWWWLEQSFGWK
jgi:dynamin 1-like protein